MDTLILGCTHFPMLSEVISEYMGEKVTLINAGEETAKTAKAALEADGLLNDGQRTGKSEFFVSDRPEGFSRIAEVFLGKKISGDVTAIDWSDVL